MTPPQEAIVADVMAMLGGYAGRILWLHIPDSRRVVSHGRGFPDLIMAGPGGVLFAECKPSTFARLGPRQTAWRYMLIAAGAEHVVWTPADLESGAIAGRLDKLAHGRAPARGPG